MGFKEELAKHTHAKILFNQPMKKHTGYGVGGKASYYTEIDSLYTLNEITDLALRYRVPFKVIGNGTNLLVSDRGYNGIIINTKRLSDVYFYKNQVRAMAGVTLVNLINSATEHKLSGLEALSGIPATVGGAVVMNAGAFGRNISDRLVAVETLIDGKIKKYEKSECEFGYRTSRFLGKKEIVISATFKLFEADKELITAGVSAYRDLRKSIQPTGRSCGSVFRNPEGYTAGKLIDELGLKGLRIGGAKVSEIHGNFILADGKATATDIATLIEYIKKKVKDAFDITLKEEVEYVGEFE